MSAALLLFGCRSAEDDDVKIGIIAPTSGDAAVYGLSAANGSKLAFDEVNKSGGLSGKMIDPILYDDHHDGTAAVNAYRTLADKDKVVAVIGAVTSTPANAVAQAARQDRMPVITPTATDESITENGDGIFRACYLDAYQSQVMAGFARNELNVKTAAVLYNPDSRYSLGLANAFIEAFEQNGGTIVSRETYREAEKNFKLKLNAVQATSAEVLYLPDYAYVVAMIAAQAEDMKLEATLLGTDGWDGILNLVDDRTILEGSFYCTHYANDDPDPVVQAFIKNYERVYNQTPNSFAALGYDAAKILAAAIETAGSADHEAIIAALKETQYQGVTGDISFDAGGNPVKRVSILKIQNEEAKLHQKVSPSF